ncbi:MULTISPECIES: gamma-glutamylcyclotransferase [Halorhodospira]|uniref:gamma-glutamylcyclotransferase n=1 Tax=Halorhodospira TaxID=85108 RepID=UPI001EE97B97|nr:gamma-glutamylcyclotransferase [Halorhodospira halophila]MCG5536963.1 gamma-glutamylcyclotransferase [Halorhodospira sp. 9622]MCG5539690.1 gamma-glutamylcyclotransferase [Halorhodospira sp. M39old]MCG5542264.1 gamma-glutamylcyclotransferase [Halorhodospira sp. 9628]MCG5545500.1 gamma-glutamylcyclotransferase [Halorhodospira sp. M38]
MRRRRSGILDGMVADTRAINRQHQPLPDQGHHWLFGYGSLIYKADFPYFECRPAAIHGWKRRFWQGSHDHRGTPEAPGRVATLIEAPGVRCVGMAYRIPPEALGPLDLREKNGYLRLTTPLRFLDGGEGRGLVYIATADNPAFLGPAPIPEMARQIASCSGPSGPNRDYLIELARALRALGEEDRHVFALEEAIEEFFPHSTGVVRP